MIPKTIHYCWFGRGEKPALTKKCIESWHKFCPDYEIVEWNEDNFDLDSNGYTRYCYANRKWAFLSDYVRLAVIQDRGGIYFDTDVELLKSPDGLLEYGAFYGFETADMVNTGHGFGAEAAHPTVEAMLEQYRALQPDEQGAYPLIPCPTLNTAALERFGLRLDGTRQNLVGAEILPVDYMNPYDEPTGRLTKTKNTLSIHWYNKSWISPGLKLRSMLTRPFHRIFGKDCFEKLRKK